MTKTFSRTTLARGLIAGTALAGALIAGGVQAQGYVGPGTAQQQGYSGPSTIPVMSVKEVIEQGRDDQNAILRGRIVSRDGDDHYTFDDGTGRIRVDIDNDDFPAGVKIDDKTKVELRGEIDRDRQGIEFDVDEVRVM